MIALMTQWMRPSRGRIIGNDPYLWALSVSLAKQQFGKVVLSCDYEGAQWAEKLRLPFDEVKVQLDGLDNVGDVFAAGKLRSFQLAQEPFASVDGDALLFKRPPGAMLRAGMFAQNREFLPAPEYVSYYGMGYNVPLLKSLRGVAPMVHDYLERPMLLAHNFGIAGFNDLELAHEYASAALHILRENESRLAGESSVECSMLVEQLLATPYAEHRGHEVAVLLAEDCSEADAQRAGYTHLIGESKTCPELLAKVEEKLFELFPAQYEVLRGQISNS